ncbi:hypothetical protein [Thermococcus sp. JCM 11816]|uniref:hypothetical protein n=1 Tax=Thermococcus sp. (strain JCM 11816 / KS-1) TaxID=1295125 RepID=UPI000B2A236A
MSKLKPAGALSIFLLLVLSLQNVSAQEYSNYPWGISLQPFVIYADSKGALVGVEYDYYEEAGLTTEYDPPVTLMPIDLWTYFIFYVNESGAYYVDYMAFSGGFELPPLAFYKAGCIFSFQPPPTRVFQ